MLIQERKTFFLQRLFSCVTTRAQWVLDTRLLPDIFFHSRPDSVLKIVGNRVNCYVSYYPKCLVLPHILGIPNILDKPNNSGNTKYWVYPTSLDISGRDSIHTTSKREIISQIPQIPECEEGTRIYNQSNISTLLPYLNPPTTQLFFQYPTQTRPILKNAKN